MKQFLTLLIAFVCAMAVNAAGPVRGTAALGSAAVKAGHPVKKAQPQTLVLKQARTNQGSTTAKSRAKKAAQATEWSEWEEFAPGGSNDAVWTLSAWQTGQMEVKTYVRTSTTDATQKQIKCTGWGAGFFTIEGVDIVLDWDTTDNSIEIPMQSTGYYVSNYSDNAVLGTLQIGNYNPEQGLFTFYVCYSVPQYFVMGQGFGIGEESLKMAGKFKDYSLSFSRGTVDDAATPIKQTVNVNKGEDITSYRVHVDTYENYAAAQGSAAYFEALAKAEGTDYTTPSATVELQGSAYNLYVVVVSAFAGAEMKQYDYALYEVSPASDWETLGMRPYREDIVTSLYNFGVTGPIYDVEVQQHKTYKDVYRIKNPYGTTSVFKNYTLYENAYLYLNAQDRAKVLPTLQASRCDLGIDIEGGVPLDVYLANNEVGGTFDGYVISFPQKALASTNYYVNTNGLFRAVINFRDTEFAFAEGATSLYTGETVEIVSNNTFTTPTFESLTPEVATVDEKGVVTALAPGKAQIKVVQGAYLEYNAKEAVMEIDVTKSPYSYGSFVFNTDEGLAALSIEKPASSAATVLTGMTLTSGDAVMTTTDGTTPTRIWNVDNSTDLRMYKDGGSFTISVPEGYAIIDMDFTGTECSLFGEVDEFATCTKTHTVWSAPEDSVITSKTFAARGTCKISVIKVKYQAAQNVPYYVQNYEKGAALDWTSQVGGCFDAEIGADASGNHYMRAAAGTRTSNSSGMYSNAYSEKLAAGTPFTMTADIHLRSADDQNGTEFAVGAAGASYDFSKWNLTGTMTLSMKQVATGGTNQWIINGDAEHPITLPGTESLASTDASEVYDAAPWYSFQLTWKDGTTVFSIKDKATGTVILDKKRLNSDDTFASVGGVGQLWFTTSRYNAAFAIDNVVIRNLLDDDLPVADTVITANVNDAAMGTVFIEGEGVIGATVSLTANANEGYCFTRWTDEGGVTVSTDNPWSITLESDTTVTANFVPLLDVEVQEEVDVPAITYDYALGAAGLSGTFDLSMVDDAIGCTAAEAIVYGYDPTTGNYIPDAMTTFGGYFSASGVPTVYGDTTPFCIKFNNDGTFWYAIHPDVAGYGVKYACFWLLVNPTTGDAVQYNFSMNDVVDAVVAQINAIGTVELTDQCGALIDAARKAYDALAEGQKAIISAEQLAVLTEAEAAYAKLAADKAAANAVVDKINAIGTVELTDQCGALIDAAREAYDALTPDQKALISAEQLAVLTEAEEVFNNSSALSGDIVVKRYEDLGWNEYDIIFTMKAHGAKTYPITLTINPERDTFVGTFTYDGEEETLNPLSTVTADGQEITIEQGSTITITNMGNDVYALSGTILYFDPAKGMVVAITLDNLTFTTTVPALNTLLSAGKYVMTATIADNEGVIVPDELTKYLGGYTAKVELTGDARQLVISSIDEDCMLSGFSIKGDAVMLSDGMEMVYGGLHFLLGDAAGNTTGALAVTKAGEDTYALADATIVYKGNVVGTVTGITFKQYEDPTTGLNGIDAKAVKAGKYLEHDKIVIIKGGVKYDITGF